MDSRPWIVGVVITISTRECWYNIPILGLGMPIVVPIFHFGLGIQPVVINSIPTHSWNRLDSDRTDMTMISVVSIRGCIRKGQNEINLTKKFS